MALDPDQAPPRRPYKPSPGPIATLALLVVAAMVATAGGVVFIASLLAAPLGTLAMVGIGLVAWLAIDFMAGSG